MFNDGNFSVPEVKAAASIPNPNGKKKSRKKKSAVPAAVAAVVV